MKRICEYELVYLGIDTQKVSSSSSPASLHLHHHRHLHLHRSHHRQEFHCHHHRRKREVKKDHEYIVVNDKILQIIDATCPVAQLQVYSRVIVDQRTKATIIVRGLMTTQASDASVSHPVSVIGPEFISPCAQEIIVDTYTLGTLVFTDTNHRTMIKVKPCSTSFHRQRVLLDPKDKPIVTLREKKMTVHDRWNVFRGDSHADSDLICSIKTEHMIQIKTSVEVLLPNSKDECDFIFKGSWSKKKCSIYVGDTSRTIADTKPWENKKFCKDKFMVTVNPNVDYAFVVAIIAVVDAMKNPEETVAAKRAGVAANVIGGFPIF